MSVGFSSSVDCPSRDKEITTNILLTYGRPDSPVYVYYHTSHMGKVKLSEAYFYKVMELAGHGPGQRHFSSRAGSLNCLLYQAEAPGRRGQHSNAEVGIAKEG